MATPFDIAAGVAGLVSLGIVAFQGCIQGFVLLSTARNLGRDADLLRCMLEWEHYRLYEWSQQAGLASETPSPALNWTLVLDILRQLEVQLNDTAKLRESYGLDVTQDDLTNELGTVWEKTRSTRSLSLRLNPRFYLESSRSIHMKNQGHPIRRLKWVTVDKAKLEALVQVIRHLIGYLWDILAFQDRREIRTSLDMLLRNAIVANNAQQDLNNLVQLADKSNSSVLSAGNLKQTRLQLDSRSAINSQTQSQDLKALILASNCLEDEVRFSSLRRGMAEYAGQRVMVEYKDVSGRVNSQDKLWYRVKNLALLLSELSDPSFHSLKCLGIVERTHECIFVFALPLPAIHPSMKIEAPDCHNLANIQRLIKPDLGTRLKWALHLAETVLQLHTAGWFHKGITPDNILFFLFKDIEPPGDRKNSKEAEGDTRTGRLHVDGPYLAGYGSARENSRSAWSEVTFSLNNYRHVSAQGEDKLSFRARFDVYALGLVLIEIGMWCQAATFVPSGNIPAYMNKPESLFEIHSQLLFALPRKYADAVLMCLTNKVLDEGLPETYSKVIYDGEDHEQSITLQQTVVTRLRECL